MIAPLAGDGNDDQVLIVTSDGTVLAVLTCDPEDPAAWESSCQVGACDWTDGVRWRIDAGPVLRHTRTHLAEHREGNSR